LNQFIESLEATKLQHELGLITGQNLKQKELFTWLKKKKNRRNIIRKDELIHFIIGNNSSSSSTPPPTTTTGLSLDDSTKVSSLLSTATSTSIPIPLFGSGTSSSSSTTTTTTLNGQQSIYLAANTRRNQSMLNINRQLVHDSNNNNNTNVGEDLATFREALIMHSKLI
jgi:hypothetical protein